MVLIFVLQWRSLHWEILIMLLNSHQDAPFHGIAYDYSRADWYRHRDRLRDVQWEDTFKLSASAAASEFWERVQVAVNLYTPHRMYQVKPHSCLCFTAAFATAIIHKNPFF